ncbi:MAG TPA: heme biosynthesis HemY N-terminal domain-containing protein [Wenzhouxiangellaceae bacterium]|nr:heme biosynthesis HemY N-terminal domain-containing protein [Wenzhouxiangellaceae bacterium]
MKRRLLLVAAGIILVSAIVTGALVGPALMENPGYVLIEIGGWRVQMSFMVLAGTVIGVWFLISLLVGLLRAPGRALRRFRAARERRDLDRGLLALSEGDWVRAERSLARAMKGSGATTSGYLAAARAAQGQAAPERRDQYLALADRRFGQRHFATALARARLLVGEGEPGAAIELLEQLHIKRPRHEGVLKLLLQSYQACDRWHDVRLLVPAIRKAGIVSTERAEELSSLAAARELESARDVGELSSVHQTMQRALKQRPETVAAFASRALELDRPELAENDLRRAIEATFDARLLDLYSRTDTGDRATRIRKCEQWLVDNPESADIHLALGRMYLDDRDDQKAREHLQIAVRKSPNPAAYAALGQVLDRAGLMESATQCYRNALRLEQGRAPDPLPLPNIDSSSGAQ